MDSTGVYVQFSTFQDSLFAVQNGLRPKASMEKIDTLSRMSTTTLTFLRFLVEILQIIPLAMVSKHLLQPNDNDFVLAYNIIAYPFSTLASRDSTWFMIVLSILTVLSLTVAIFYVVSGSNFRKRDVSVTRFPISSAAYCLLGIVYLQDILYLAFGSFSCDYLGHFRQLSGLSCASSNPLPIILAVLLLGSLIPTLYFVTLTSPLVDYRRTLGNIATVRVDLFTVWLKVFVALQTTLILASEAKPGGQIEDEDGQEYFSKGLRIALHACTFIAFSLVCFYQLVQCPHTNDRDNRLRAATLAIGAGLAIVGVVKYAVEPSLETAGDGSEQTDFSLYPAALVGDTDIMQEDAGTDDDSVSSPAHVADAWFAIVSVLSGCMAFAAGLHRKSYLSKLRQLDVNSMSGGMDPGYIQDLLDIIVEGGFDMAAANIMAVAGDRASPSETAKAVDAATTAALQRMTGVPESLLRTSPQPDATLATLQQNLNKGGTARPPRTDAPPRRGQTGPVPPRLTTSPFSESGSLNETTPPSPNFQSGPATHPGASPLAEAPPTVQEGIMGPRYAATRKRLMGYMESQNFVSICKSLIFTGDVEILLRDTQQEWHTLSPIQQEVTRASWIQLLAALIVRSASGQATDGAYFLWFGSIALQLTSDFNTTPHIIKLAAESTTSLDTLFLCYLLQKGCEEAKNNAANAAVGTARAKRSTGVSDLASFRRWTSNARLSHEKALNSLRKFFKGILAGGTGRLHGVESANLATDSDRKFTADSRANLREAVSLLRQTEDAYSTLVQRFPQASEAHRLNNAFLLQFFREDLSSSGGSDKNGTEDDFSHAGSSLASSLGSALAESPKQQQLSNITRIVKATFTKVRVYTLLASLVVVGLTIFFTVMNVIELDKVEVWLDAYEQVVQVFDVMPYTCTIMMRSMNGYGALEAGLYGPVHEATMEQIPFLETAGVADGDIIPDEVRTACTSILDAAPQAQVCMYSPAGVPHSIVVARTPTTPPAYIGEFPIDDPTGATYTKMAKAAWTTAQARYANGELTRESQKTYGVQMYDVGATVEDVGVTISYGLFFSPGLGVSDTSALQGVVTVRSFSLPNLRVSREYSRTVLPNAERIRTQTIILRNVAVELGMDNLIDLIADTSQYTFAIYPKGYSPAEAGGEYDKSQLVFRSMALTEAVGTFMDTISKVASVIQTHLRRVTVEDDPNYKSLMDFCASPAVVVAPRLMLQTFADHLIGFVDGSVLIVVMCALTAAIAALVGGLATVSLVRKFLSQFDRSDGVSPALAILASFPRTELRRLGRNVTLLRVDRGVLDPDDEKAAHMDLKLTRKQYRHQRALEDAALNGAKEYRRQLEEQGGARPAREDEGGSWDDGGIVGEDVELPLKASILPPDSDFASGGISEGRAASSKGKASSSKFGSGVGGALEHFSGSEALRENLGEDEDHFEAEEEENEEHNLSGRRRDVGQDEFAPPPSPTRVVVSDNVDRPSKLKPANRKGPPKAPGLHFDNLASGPRRNTSEEDFPPAAKKATPPPARGVVLDPAQPVQVYGGGVAPLMDDQLTTSSKSRSSSVSASCLRYQTLSIIRRPLSRIFLIIWTVVCGYLVANLVVASNSVKAFATFYDDISVLMQSSFAMAVASLHATNVIRGRDNMAWRTQPYDQFVSWFDTALEDSHELFFSIIDRVEPGSTDTVGRRSPDRASMLYEIQCFSTAYPCDATWRSTNATTDGTSFANYPQQSLYWQGLVRAVVSFYAKGKEYMADFAGGEGRQLEASDHDLYILFNSRAVDIEPGMVALRGTFADEAAAKVVNDVDVQWVWLGVGVGLVLVTYILTEVVLRRAMVQFYDTAFVLKMIPHRLLDDYRVVERVLNIQADEDDFGAIGQATTGTPTGKGEHPGGASGRPRSSSKV